MQASLTHAPVVSTDITSRVSGNTTTINDDTEKDETGTSDDLQKTESKFDLHE